MVTTDTPSIIAAFPILISIITSLSNCVAIGL